MPTKEALLKKLLQKPTPRGFTVKDLESLMSKCSCKRFEGGVKKVISFLQDVGEIDMR